MSFPFLLTSQLLHLPAFSYHLMNRGTPLQENRFIRTYYLSKAYQKATYGSNRRLPVLRTLITHTFINILPLLPRRLRTYFYTT
jgi:hypothetical protein